MQTPGCGEGLTGQNRIIAVQFTHQEAVSIIFIRDFAEGFDEVLNGRLIELRAVMQLPEEGLLLLRQAAQLKVRFRQVVAIRRGICIDRMHRIYAKPVDAAIEPKTRNLLKGFNDTRIGMIEIGLAWQEIM